MFHRVSGGVFGSERSIHFLTSPSVPVVSLVMSNHTSATMAMNTLSPGSTSIAGSPVHVVVCAGPWMRIL